MNPIPQPPPRFMNRTALFLATGAGAGFVPVAPGTAGSLVAFAILLFVPDFQARIFGISVALLSGIGVWAATRAERHFQQADAQQIVIDEIAGMFISVAGLPAGWKTCLLALVLFRIFDIVKPFPVRQAERVGGYLASFRLTKAWAAQYGSGLGVMLDDLIAGLYANLLAQAIFWLAAVR